ncbi:MAG: hypothetical protein HZA91_17695 [Verrucomicrobia bacterium]|nr:hypothetical protein [Verrucomicrobiota bacterium]
MSQPTTPQFKDRRTGLVIFGVLEILIGCLCALVVPAMLFSDTVSYQIMIPGAVFYAAIGAALIWLGIGSIRCRRWARAMMLVLSWSWLILGVVVMAMCAFLMPQLMASQPDAPTIWIGMAIAGLVVVTIFLIIPVVLMLFYRSAHVRATCEARDPAPRWTDACPLPVLAASLWLGLGAASMFAIPLCSNSVVPCFGALISGPVASIIFVAMGVVWVWLAWGLYWLRFSGWLASVVVLLLVGISTALTFLRVDIMDLGVISNQTMAAWTTVLFALILGYLFWIKKHFRRTA